MSNKTISSSVEISFKQRFGKINWDQVMGIDLEAIINQGDIESLQSTLENLTYSVLDREDLLRIKDSNVVKVFKLSQLAIEYLISIHSQLDTSGKDFIQKQKKYYEENTQIKENLIELEKEYNELKNEYREKRKALQMYELMLKQPGTAALMNKVVTRANAITCEFCKKAFISQEFLDEHKKRRHMTNVSQDSAPSFDVTPFLEVFKTFADQRIQAVTEAHKREIESLKELMKIQLEIQKDHENAAYQKLITYQAQQANLQEDMYKKLLIETQFEKDKLSQYFNEDLKKIEEKEHIITSLREANKTLTLEVEEKEHNLNDLLSHDNSIFESIEVEEKPFRIDPQESPIKITEDVPEVRVIKPDNRYYFGPTDENRQGTPPPQLIKKHQEELYKHPAQRFDEKPLIKPQPPKKVVEQPEDLQDYAEYSSGEYEKFTVEVVGGEKQPIEVIQPIKIVRESNAGDIESDSASDSDERPQSNAGEIETDSDASEEDSGMPNESFAEELRKNEKKFDENDFKSSQEFSEIEIISINAERIETKAIGAQKEEDFEEVKVVEKQISINDQEMTREQAAKLLGINPKLHKNYMFIVDKYLKSPLPAPWDEIIENSEKIYINPETKVKINENPKIKIFSLMFIELKQKHNSLYDHISLLPKTGNIITRPSDKKVIQSHFVHSYEEIEKHKAKMYEEVVLGKAKEKKQHPIGSISKKDMKEKKQLIEVYVKKVLTDQILPEHEKNEMEAKKLQSINKRKERLSDISVIKGPKDPIEHEKDLWYYRQGIEHIQNRMILKDTGKVTSDQFFQEGPILGDYYFERNSGVMLDEISRERVRCN